MAGHVFDDLGYRRYEWKCSEANLASKRVARRFGFTYEGLFRNGDGDEGKVPRHRVVFDYRRGMAALLEARSSQWLAHANFATDGAQAEDA